MLLRTASFSLLLALAIPAQNLGISLSNTVDGYVEIPYSAAVIPQSGITVEGWITYDESTLPTGWRYPTLLRQNLAAGAENYYMRIAADNSAARRLKFKVITSVGTSLSATWSFGPGQLLTWTHVAGTYDGSQVRLFVNGLQVAQSAATGNGNPIRDNSASHPAAENVLRIGKGSDIGSPMEVWNGEIDEVRLWPFARTEAEIQQTMNFQLYSVPGRVSTWNLDSHTIDTSGGQHGTAVGAVNYSANTLSLTSLPSASGSAVGASTPGCEGPILMSFGSLPQPGNLDFAAVCTRVPTTAVPFLAVSFATVSTPLQVAGIDVWISINNSVGALAAIDGLGTARFPVALPSWLPPGFGLAFQYAFIDPCGPQGVTASDAMFAVTQ